MVGSAMHKTMSSNKAMSNETVSSHKTMSSDKAMSNETMSSYETVSSHKTMTSDKTMSNKAMSSYETMSSVNHRGSVYQRSSMDSMVDHRGSMDQGSSMDSMVSNRMGHSMSLRVGRHSIVRDLGDISVVVVGVVVDSLNTTVGKVDLV